MNITGLLNGLQTTPVVMFFGLLALGVLVAFVGIYSAASEKNIAAARMAGGISKKTRVNEEIIKRADEDPKGFTAGFIPDDKKKRTQIERELHRAGFRSPSAVRNYFVVRILLAIMLPSGFFLLSTAAHAHAALLPDFLIDTLTGLSKNQLILIVGLLCIFGYSGPGYWLNGRISSRREKIEQAFPNALDLLQISVEAGLGFDAAMARVSRELAPVAPELSEEFLLAQADIQAGRERGEALLAMARRVDIDTVSSFAGVVMQSIQFGTSMADALTTYSKEMRLYRELKAQEKANQLPVKMSAVLASLMLPAIILISLGPVVIRYIRYFG